MIGLLRHSTTFILIILIWILFAYTNLALLYAVIPVSLLLMLLSGMYVEMVLGLYLFLVVSDLRHEIAFVAQLFREVYVVSLAGLLLLFIGRFRPIPKMYLFFIPFLISGLLTSVISTIPFVSFQKTLSYTLIMIVFPGFVMASYRRDKSATLQKIVYFGLLVLLIGFVLKFVNPRLVEFAQEGGRYKGIFGNPNGLGIFCVVYTVIATTIISYYPMLFSRFSKVLIIGSIAVSAILCESRGALFSLAIFFVFLVLSNRSHVLSFALLLFALISYQWILQNFSDLVITFGLQDYFRLRTLETGSGRLVAFEFAWKHIQKSFWFGGGMGYTEHLFHDPEHIYYLRINNHQGNAHNSFLTIWLDTGLIGLIFRLWAWISLVLKATRFSRLAIPISFSIIFSAFFESWMAGSLNAFTMFFVLSIFFLTYREFTQGDEEAQPARKFSTEASGQIEYAP